MNVRWQDWVNVALGCWLAVSPWQMGYWLNKPAAGNACGVGAVIVFFNLISACRMTEEGQELFNIVLGTWLVFSPFALGFKTNTVLMSHTMLVGAMISGLAVWQIHDAMKK